jgi:poly(3-hydroxybutyrate) depolymerase
MARLVLFPLLLISTTHAQDIVIREGLGIRVPGARRSAIHTDPVELKIVRGEWKAPMEGQEGWAKASANSEGVFQGGPASGGYIFARVDSPAAKVMLLEATGNSLVYVNGVIRTGDPYSYGYVSLPIELKKGQNQFLFLCGRGRFSARLKEVSKPLAIDLRDATTPDVLSGQYFTPIVGVVLRNASSKRRTVLLTGVGDKGRLAQGFLLPPLSTRKVPLPVLTTDGKVRLTLKEGDVEADTAELTLRVRKSTETHKRTFLSDIDESVQYYGVNPSSSSVENQALFLSLHGASVEAIGQAEAYGQKNWGNLVAATNRRPYGFDWEEIGRLDALEVLAEAKRVFQPDPSKIYLTGHSMGGHGTWQLGVQYPHLFAAIAPSAGWISFQSYANGQRFENPSPVEQMLLRAGSPSDTLALKQNLFARGVYILHGDADDNVPVAQARQMREALAGHKDLDWWEEKGAGHWWDANPEPGSDAVDFAPIFDFFSRRRLPRIDEVREVDFTTASPGVSSQLHWATIHQQERPFVLSRVRLKASPQTAKFEGTTENVSVLSLSIGALAKGQKITIDLDGQKLEPTWPTINRIFLYKKAGQWSAGGDPSPVEKSPVRYGGFKDVFRNKVIFVYGTKGNAEENAWSLAKARYDAETFWYRGNGSVSVVPDTEFVKEKADDRNVLLYGNADTNGAWGVLLRDSPVKVTRKSISVGREEFAADDLATLFIRPRAGSETASVGVIAGTGMAGSRLCDRVPIFTSGAAFPDLLVLGPDSLSVGSKGIRLTGFFGNDWRVESGEWAK